MRKILIITTLLLVTSASAQNTNELPRQDILSNILRQIEANNLTLKALREQAEADKLGNRKGIALLDPEIEGGRLWGRPAEIGNRVDFSISQGIDLATLSGARLKQAKSRNELVELGFLTQRTAILLQAKQLLIEDVYWNSLATRQHIRASEFATLRDNYKKMLDSGEVSELEYNNVATNAMMAQNNAQNTTVQSAQVFYDLQAMNGGLGIEVPDEYVMVFPPDNTALPDDFDQWFDSVSNRIPALQQARREAEISQKEVGLARAEGLPKLKVGYMQERTLGQRYGGVTAGLSIPLWSNRNNVRTARAAAAASAARGVDQQVQIREKLAGLHYSVRYLKTMIQWNKGALERVAASKEMLWKALDLREISYVECAVAMQQYYDLEDKALEAERDYHLAMAELTAFEL